MISIPFIALHSTHTALQLPQSPLLPCRRNISSSANSYQLKRRKFHYCVEFVLRYLNYLEFAVLCWNTCFVNWRERPCSRVAFVGWAFQSMSHGSYPDFLPIFFPTEVFSGRFFLASVLTVFCVNCRSALF